MNPDKETHEQSSNSNGKSRELLISGSRMPLLKPVSHNPFFAGAHYKWYVINVSRSGGWSRRFYLNLSRHPRQLPKVLSTVLRAPRWRNWHTFFLLTPARDFMYWRLRFPMSPMLAREAAADEGNTSYLRTCRKKLRSLQHQARKLKRLVASHAPDEAPSTQKLIRRSPPQVVCDQRKPKGELQPALLPKSATSSQAPVQVTELAHISEDPAPEVLEVLLEACHKKLRALHQAKEAKNVVANEQNQNKRYQEY